MTGAMEQTPLYAQEHTDYGGAPQDGFIIKMCACVIVSSKRNSTLQKSGSSNAPECGQIRYSYLIHFLHYLFWFFEFII